MLDYVSAAWPTVAYSFGTFFRYFYESPKFFIMRLLQIEKTPIVLGLLLVFLTWGTKHQVMRITATPFIEYRVSHLDGDKYDDWKAKYSTSIINCSSQSPMDGPVESIMIITMTNLSDNKLLEKVSLAFGFPPNSAINISGSQLLSKAPALKPDDSEQCGSKYAQLNNLTFHPKSEYTLALATSGYNEPYAVLIKSKQATIFNRSNTATWFVRYEFEIIMVLLVVATILAAVYLYVIASVSNGSSLGGGDNED